MPNEKPTDVAKRYAAAAKKLIEEASAAQALIERSVQETRRIFDECKAKENAILQEQQVRDVEKRRLETLNESSAGAYISDLPKQTVDEPTEIKVLQEKQPQIANDAVEPSVVVEVNTAETKKPSVNEDTAVLVASNDTPGGKQYGARSAYQQPQEQQPSVSGTVTNTSQRPNDYKPRDNTNTRPPQRDNTHGTSTYAPRTGGTSNYPPRTTTGTSTYAPRSNTGTSTYAPRTGTSNYPPRSNTGTSTYAPRSNTGTSTYAPRTGTSNYPPRTGNTPSYPRTGTSSASAPTTANKDRGSSFDPNKSAYTRARENERRAKNKKAILRETAPTPILDDDSPIMGNRRKARRMQQQMPQHRPEPIVIDHAVITTETVTVKELSEKIGKPVADIIKKLFLVGILANINQEIEYDVCELVSLEYGITLEKQLTKTFEEVLTESADDIESDSHKLSIRPPIVTIMGHVDHGKTSLLDAIRHSSVTTGEAGGITQHIGAYTVACNDKQITFIDTPGHEAFTSMRARGAQVTDIVILVVAADDGIMPQTIEAINHAKAAEVPIIVAINKMDKPSAEPERIKQQLTEYGLVVEDWGGDTICVNVSAKTKQGLDLLLEMVLLQAEVLELKANTDRLARGTIIEAELHKSKGPLATVLVQNGTLKVGDTIVAGTSYGRVRAMIDDKGRRVNSAGPSCPVQVLGFSQVPQAGDTLNVAEIDKLSRQVAEERRDKQKAEQIKLMSKVSLEELYSQIAEGQVKDLNVIVKADVHGSVEAVKQALEKLSTDEVRVRCIHGGVGAITSSDVLFASASNAIIIGFNVRPDSGAKADAEREGVDMRLYRIIYNAIEDVQKAMLGMFEPQYKEVELGHISVRDVFKVSGVGTIAGGYVQDGKVSRNAQVRVVRGGIVVHEGKIASLKRFKDDAKEVATGYECGIGIEGFNDIVEGDTIEAFVMEEVKRTL